MIKDRYFIFTGLQSWELNIGSNAKDIAWEISKNNKVLYINYPLDLRSFLKINNDNYINTSIIKIKNKLNPITKINDNLWVLDLPFFIYPTNIFPDGKIFDFINRKNNIKIFKYVNRIAKELSFKNIIHFNDNDIYRSFYAKEFLKPSLSIYYRRDNLLTVPYWRNHALRLEPLLINKSDIILTNSFQMAKFAQKYNTNSFDIGQGIDLSFFDSKNYSIPKDICHIPRPIVGYVGLLTCLRLDVSLIHELASKTPDCSFVFVGKEDLCFTNHEIHKLNNVYFIGEKDISEVSNYIYSFDICINPQILNEITIGNYPRKVDEYLALGKPTIATKTSTMELFADYVHLCSSIEDYQFAIKKSLLEINDNSLKIERINFAKTHTWEVSVSKLYKHILEYINLK